MGEGAAGARGGPSGQVAQARGGRPKADPVGAVTKHSRNTRQDRGKVPLSAPHRPATAARVQRKRLGGGRFARKRASAGAWVGPAHLPRLPSPFGDGAPRLLRGLPPEGPRRG